MPVAAYTRTCVCPTAVLMYDAPRELAIAKGGI